MLLPWVKPFACSELKTMLTQQQLVPLQLSRLPVLIESPLLFPFCSSPHSCHRKEISQMEKRGNGNMYPFQKYRHVRTLLDLQSFLKEEEQKRSRISIFCSSENISVQQSVWQYTYTSLRQSWVVPHHPHLLDVPFY